MSGNAYLDRMDLNAQMRALRARYADDLEGENRDSVSRAYARTGGMSNLEEWELQREDEAEAAKAPEARHPTAPSVRSPAPDWLDWAYQRGFANGYQRGRESAPGDADYRRGFAAGYRAGPSGEPGETAGEALDRCGCVQDAGVVADDTTGGGVAEAERRMWRAGYAAALVEWRVADGAGARVEAERVWRQQYVWGDGKQRQEQEAGEAEAEE
jgi:hypothetical protein